MSSISQRSFKITAIVLVSKTLLVLIYDDPFRFHFALNCGKRLSIKFRCKQNKLNHVPLAI